MSIRWKLFLTFFLLTGGATALVLVAAEREFQSWVKEEVGERFEAEVRGLLESRAERLAPIRTFCAEQAKHQALRAELLGEGTPSLRRSLLHDILESGVTDQLRPPRPLPRPPERDRPATAPPEVRRPSAEPDPERLPPVMGVVDLQGRMTHLGRAMPKEWPASPAERARRLGQLASNPSQQVSYVSMPEGPAPGPVVKEMVVTPILDEDTSVLGWFFFGIDAETPVERAFQQAERASGRDGRSGLVVNGEWFVRGVSPAEAQHFARAVGTEFWTSGAPQEVVCEGKPFLLFAKDLNPDSPLGKGFQLVVFPLEALHEAVAHLRLAVCALGGCAMGAGLLLAFLFAQRFSRPIAALVEGTERVRSGDLAGKVPVRSKDEFGRLAGAFNAMTADLALKERYREVLAKVSDPAVAQRLVEGDLALGGEVRKAAVLFCDIRGFTAMTEGMDPCEVIALVNEHMTSMTKLVYLHGGVVDKFVGDLVMALFGVPVSSHDDAARAAHCALEMIAARQRLNEASGRTVEIGIGVAYGELVAGCMGSDDRLNYTVLGDRVNLASRLCSAAAAGEVLVDGDVAAALGDQVRIEVREPINLKGFSEPVPVFALRTPAAPPEGSSAVS